jgi:two-component system response regulator AtoC
MFEAASGGTMFLDEIGDMDVRLQAKLLQVLQDREFQRIGGTETIKVDVRIMAATHRDLEKSIAEGTFREDLYYRLNVINIHLPPLRERKQDIIPMAEHLIRTHATTGTAVSMSPELRNAMITYGWPGNIRELENVVRKLLVLRDPEFIVRELNTKGERKSMKVNRSVPEAFREDRREPEGIRTFEEVNHAKQHAERKAILAALTSSRWNRKQAAALLQVEYKALLYKMKKLGVENEDLQFIPAVAEGLERSLSWSAE